MPHTVDTVVIGGSAGSLSDLIYILSRLPADFPATVFVCKHYALGAPSLLADILAPKSTLPVVAATDSMAIATGTVVVAVPDMHMMLGNNHVHLRRGAHENNFRPAIDPLFRSAAVYRGTRAVGVILSGLLDDGAAGARALAGTGGQILTLPPAGLDYSSMPQSVLDTVPGAVALDPPAIAARLAERCGRDAAPPLPVPADLGIELKIAGLEGNTMENEARLGTLSPYNCPHCNGVLWEIEDGETLRYRCHTGHGYTLQSLSEAQEIALDQRLFDTLRAHRGRSSLIRKLARQSPAAARPSLETRARMVEEDAQRIESIIRGRHSHP